MIGFTRSCAIAIGVSIAVFAVMQLLFGGPHCLDCGARVGVPFSYMQEGLARLYGRLRRRPRVLVCWPCGCGVARKLQVGRFQLTEADKDVRREELLEFLSSKEPA